MFKKLIIFILFITFNIYSTEMEVKTNKEKEIFVEFIIDSAQVKEAIIDILINDLKESTSIDSFKQYNFMIEWYPFTIIIPYQDLLKEIPEGFERKIILDEFNITFKDNAKLTTKFLKQRIIDPNKTYFITDLQSDLSQYIYKNKQYKNSVIKDKYDENRELSLLILDGTLSKKIPEIMKFIEEKKLNINNLNS